MLRERERKESEWEVRTKENAKQFAPLRDEKIKNKGLKKGNAEPLFVKE